MKCISLLLIGITTVLAATNVNVHKHKYGEQHSNVKHKYGEQHSNVKNPTAHHHHYESSPSKIADKVKVNAPSRYTPPAVYSAALQFRLPYMSFTETLDVQVDMNQGLMKLNYFSGMDTYIFNQNANTTSYSIVPVYDTLSCLSTFSNTETPLEALFPDLTLFTLQDLTIDVTIPLANSNGKTISYNVFVWEYSFCNADNNANFSSCLPDLNGEGYSGTYNFYVDTVTGNPVAFKAVGHNVVVGGSHTDEYWLDYIQVTPQSLIDPAEFNAPVGMTCANSNNPFGPTASMGGDAMRSNPLDDIAMMFPHSTRGQTTRNTVFSKFTTKFGKKYENEAERKYRHAVFMHNLRFINSGNRRGLSYVMAVNHLADQTMEEKSVLNGRVVNNKIADIKLMEDTPPSNENPAASCGEYTVSGNSLPSSIDWRSVSNGGTQPEPGMVNPPKDQGTCGSCWSFGFTGTIEGQWALKTKELVKLSEQNIMDCSWYYQNNACGGGQDVGGFAWLLEQNNGQLALDSSYGGYLNQDGFCHFSVKDGLTKSPFSGQTVQAGATIKSCTHVTNQWNFTNQVVSNNDAVNALNDALVNVGPISVSIDASLPDFYYYHSGYYYNPQCANDLNDLDHTVLAVGYTTYNGQIYTIVRNSWSSHWGMNGYIYISQSNNNCGVATAAAFVSV